MAKMSEQENHLLEGPHFLEWHYSYLIELNELWSEGRKIYYPYMTWIDNSLTFRKCWQADEVSLSRWWCRKKADCCSCWFR
jgi:hypothetical protein